jgi:hypothetical protein
LVSLCLGVLGRHLEDVIEELSEISVIFPPDIKMTLLGIAKRRGMLSDSVLLALVDCSWELLDISGSDVTDAGLQNVAETCLHLKVVDPMQPTNFKVNLCFAAKVPLVGDTTLWVCQSFLPLCCI